MSDKFARVLGVSRFLLTSARILNLACGAAFLAMVAASFVFEPTFREYFSRRPPLDPDSILPVMRLWVLVGLPMFAAVHVMLSRLLEMIGTVRAGDPFVPENAARVKTVAWCLLVVQLFELACGIFISVLTRAGADIGDWDPSLSGWIAVLLLFVLARVFEEGARIRADLEAMV
ncbi:MAG TPA: DUF2975 domain-containing protein [Allosphingosinicella sp.]|nr:DUF2975 domain-containing protein [Allosphingosinicella sp.]